MQVSVKGKNLHVSDSLKSYAEKKLDKVTKHFNGVIEASIELTVEKNPSISKSQHVEITLYTNGPTIRAQQSSPDMFASIDETIKKIERQIESYKGKAFSHKAGEVEGAVAPKGATSAPGIVKAKKFPLKPMSVFEASLQIDLLQHDFYVFKNSDTDEVNVIYKRKDGNYGLIEPS